MFDNAPQTCSYGTQYSTLSETFTAGMTAQIGLFYLFILNLWAEVLLLKLEFTYRLIT